jgi:hypothetical protein
MKKGKFVVLLLFFNFHLLLAQQNPWKIHSTITVQDLDLVSIDNQNNIYVSNTKGDLLKYDVRGNLLNQYSPTWQGKLSHLDASWTFYIFSFSNDLQEFRFLDRLMNPLSENRIQNLWSGTAKAATPGINNVLWVWDDAELVLKKWDLKREMVLQQQALNLIKPQFTFQLKQMLEHQNFLFLLFENHQLLILDLQANIVAEYQLPPTEQLSLWNNFLITKKEQFIYRLDWKNNIVNNYPIPEKFIPYQFKMMTNFWVAYHENELLLIENKEN